ncbi:MAG: STAS domain-containing protein [Pyrinomonadaceae bacterium]|nr:STAS domain-containing protein [Pyrinomonadaceae bacterium]
MPTEIKQSENHNGTGTVFRVSGDMLLEDAVLLQRFVKEAGEDRSKTVTIDLADLHFIDSEAAAVLRRLQHDDGVHIAGVEIFLQSAIDSAERLGD